MKRVLKWVIPVDDQDHPIGAGEVALVAIQNPSPGGVTGVVTVWTVEREGQPDVRSARVYGTGHPAPDEDELLGGVMDGPLVWHVFRSTR